MDAKFYLCMLLIVLGTTVVHTARLPSEHQPNDNPLEDIAKRASKILKRHCHDIFQYHFKS